MDLLEAITIIESEITSFDAQLVAFSYIAKNKLQLSLQGFYGRTIESLVEQGYLDKDGNILDND